MAKNEEKNVDLELLIFYLGISIVSFGLYIYRHPIVYVFYKAEYSYGLMKEYLPDLTVFLSIFAPYIFIVIFLIVKKISKDAKINDDFFIVLFFPILSFFYKGMALFEIYVDLNVFEVVKDNFAFFSFILIGPGIVLFNKILIKVRLKKRNS
ncbi:MAG TPA: hypothetical protein PLO89_04870 [Spirochaetota bacterium]|nr:hypothetical protein [Spirochaetota bacterium]